MPLDHSGSRQSVSNNIRAERSAGKPQAQAVAIALDVARRAKRAKGGAVHVGPIKGSDPGRTDTVDMSVPDGAYVIPSETISHLGQSNTDAGMEKAQYLFGPSGVHTPRKSGGRTNSAKAVPCVTANGEFVVSPETVRHIGHGDIDFGHKILDYWIMMMRKDHIKTLQELEPPAKD